MFLIKYMDESENIQKISFYLVVWAVLLIAHTEISGLVG